MPQQALYLKWRPLSFDDVVGQDHITLTLRNSLKSGRIRHAYLFSGPRGTGKTTMARLLAKAVNCLHEDYAQRPCNACAACVAVNEGRYLDLIEIDAATHTGVDDVRDLREKIAFTPGEGRYKVYIIDEVHRFTGNAFDALLKTLEEPPAHAIFVLATTEIDKVPATIKSRCLQFEFRRVSLMEVADRLQMIAEAEGLHVERGALELVARQGTGSVRDSISLLDQIVSDPDDSLTLDVVQRILGTGSSQSVRELVAALVAGDVPRGLHVINDAVDSGSDPRQFGQQVIEHLRAVLLAQTSSADLVEASSDDRALFTQQAQAISRGALLRAVRNFNEAINDFKGGWQPQLALELALIDSIRDAEPEPVYAPAPRAAASASTAPAQAAPPTDAPPTVEASAPGSPPLVAPAAVQGRWNELLTAVYRYSRSGPEVLRYYRVQRVDGNVVYLQTDHELYFQRLHGQQEKLNVIERALWDVHRVALRVQVLLVDKLADDSSPQPSSGEIDDPVLRQALELGGRMSSDDYPSTE